MNAPRPAHAAYDDWPCAGGEFEVGGVPLSRLAMRVGSTPFYAYDRSRITSRVTALRRMLPAGLRVHYAVKANPMPAVVQHLAGLVDGLDVASTREMNVALDTGIAPARVSFAGPGKTDDDLLRAAAAGIVINVESPREVEVLGKLARRLESPPRVAVRVNPDFELKSSGMRMSGGAKVFGIDAERAPAVLERIGELGLGFEGLHIFSGAQNLRAEAIEDAQRKTVELGIRLAAHAPSPVRTLNIGGGFGIPYFPGDTPLDVEAVARGLAALMPLVQASLPGSKVVLELGRFLVGEAGVYVCRIIERKVSRGRVFLVTDGGLHHHLAAAGLFGQVIRKNYPVLIGNRTGGERERVTVTGPLCTPLDVLADDMDLARASSGDLVVVLQSGAYGLTASPTAFLSHPTPVEILV